MDEALQIKNTDIVNELSLPPVKIHCSVLAEDAIKAAISDYKKKTGDQRPKPSSNRSVSRRAAAERDDHRHTQGGREDPRDVREAWASTADCVWVCWAADARA